ncbi:MAG: hypothetical protein DRI95_03970 [Bacteroidetes bacterium]|nr:MAG: hypothetical protein DRI95_03970 [Bacteroidota bacterium]RLD80811.1 MAG: hypothetical protein DRJ07_10000 [Bacteroidota bacterium]
MKKLILACISILVIFIVVFTYSCKKQDVYRVIKISTDTIANISDTTALVFGTIIDAGDGITQYGHCWSTNEEPTILDNFIDNGATSETGEFTSTLKDLVPGTVYYIKAYASNGAETIYGEQKFFSSGKGLPKLSITNITNIDKASAICEVNITSDGGETILTKGLVWGINENPVIGYSDGFSTEEGDLSNFTSEITSVSPESTIYVRAYASNENGIAYSEQQEITMLTPESGDYIWARNYGKNNVDYGEKIWIDASGNTYLTGTFKSATITFGDYTLNNTGEDDIFLVKFDANGNVLWARSAEGANFDFVSGITGDASGNVYLTGSSGNITFGSYSLTIISMFLVKYDSSGNVQWAKGFNNNPSEGIACDASGNIFMTGYGDAANFTSKKTLRTKWVGLYNIFVAKFNSSGDISWAKNIGVTTFGSGLFLYADLCVDPGGNVYATGNFFGNMVVNGVHTLTNSGGADIYIVKYDNDGNYSWSGKAGGSGNDYGISICSSTAGDIYLTGNYSGNTITFGTETLTNFGQIDLFVAKYDGSGNSVWAKGFGGPDNDYGSGICTDASGNIYLSGSFSSNEVVFDSETIISRGESDILITKHSSSGDVIWAQSAGSLLHDEGKSIAANGNYVYITGNVEGPVVYFDYFELPYLGLADVFVSKIRQ